MSIPQCCLWGRDFFNYITSEVKFEEGCFEHANTEVSCAIEFPCCSQRVNYSTSTKSYSFTENFFQKNIEEQKESLKNFSPLSECNLQASSIYSEMELRVCQLFEENRSDLFWLKQAIMKLPKTDLHNHLAPHHVHNLDYAVEKRMFFDPVTNEFSNSKGRGKIKAKDLLLSGAANFFQNYANAVTMPEAKKGKERIEHFFDTFNVIMSTGMEVEEMLRGEIREMISGNVTYAELIVDFPHDPSCRPDFANFSMEKLDTFYEGIQEWCENYAKRWRVRLEATTKNLVKKFNWEHPWNSSKNPIVVAMLAEIMRTPSMGDLNGKNTLPKFFADTAAAMYLAKTAPEYVHGINVVGPEHHPSALEDFNSQMKIIQFLNEKMGGVKIALHIGELPPEVSVRVSDLRERFSCAIGAGAKRLSHALSIGEQEDAVELMAEMKKKQIAIESCLTSNQQIFGVALENHPVKEFIKNGVPVTFSTDDPHILHTDMTKELLKSFTSGICSDYLELKRTIRNGVFYSFLPGEGIYEVGNPKSIYKKKWEVLVETPESGWSEKQKKMVANSEKAALQLRFEEKMRLAERKIIAMNPKREH